MDSLCHPCITTTHRSYSVLSLKLPPPPCAVLLVFVRCYWHYRMWLAFRVARSFGSKVCYQWTQWTHIEHPLHGGWWLIIVFSVKTPIFGGSPSFRHTQLSWDFIVIQLHKTDPQTCFPSKRSLNFWWWSKTAGSWKNPHVLVIDDFHLRFHYERIFFRHSQRLVGSCQWGRNPLAHGPISTKAHNLKRV